MVNSVSELYRKNDKPGTIYILGSAPCLRCFISAEKEEKLIVIGLNNSFLFFRPDIHFYACDQFYEDYHSQLDKSLVVLHSNTLPIIGAPREYIYNPTRMLWNYRTESLIAGHSVLIPALHFALLLEPTEIVLYGIDMNNTAHWNDPEACVRRFPAALRVCRGVELLMKAFPEVPIYCENDQSLLVRKGILPCLPQHTKQVC